MVLIFLKTACISAGYTYICIWGGLRFKQKFQKGDRFEKFLD